MYKSAVALTNDLQQQSTYSFHPLQHTLLSLPLIAFIANGVSY